MHAALSRTLLIAAAILLAAGCGGGGDGNENGGGDGAKSDRPIATAADDLARTADDAATDATPKSGASLTDVQTAAEKAAENAAAAMTAYRARVETELDQQQAELEVIIAAANRLENDELTKLVDSMEGKLGEARNTLENLRDASADEVDGLMAGIDRLKGEIAEQLDAALEMVNSMPITPSLP